MIFTSPLQRIDPPNVAAEKPALETCLDYHRATLLAKLEGLTQEQAGRRLVGSDTTLHGLIRHMTTIEQWWFVECVAGSKEPYAYYDGEEVDWDWDLTRSEGLQPDVERYLAICARARDIMATADLDRTFTTKRGTTIDVRRVMIGMIEEYARHCGHADILRELTDGTTEE
ncbi:DinB family protein [Nonomuraea sp. H19]|uniref:DinB family protein n=1 Tax=Nonomuraea sp. H19 TaxID=3452206 RepID=UPI003F8C8B89